MASGVFRHGVLIGPDRYKLVCHGDGKTATVSVTAQDTIYSLRNNGKSDAVAQQKGATRPGTR